VHWLVISFAVSVILTVLLNVGLRVFPNAADHLTRRLYELTSSAGSGPGRHVGRSRIFIPWKAMIIGSIALTILVNLLLWMTWRR
jgi:hypothetical protein